MLDLKSILVVLKNEQIIFSEIENYCEKNNINYKGNETLYYKNNKNLVVWDNLSIDFVNQLNELLKNKEIKIIHTCAVFYCAKGRTVKLPVYHNTTDKKDILSWYPSAIIRV